MKKVIVFSLLFCLLLAGCDSDMQPHIAETEEITKEITILTEPHTVTEATEAAAETTAIATTEATTEATTVATTEATTVATTTATTEATTETTTAATAETSAEAVSVTTAEAVRQEPEFIPLKTVLDGEYTFGGEPIIETVNGATYVNGILIVNKTYPLPENYDPKSLDPDAEAAFDSMKEAAATEGLTLKIISGYRPYSQQYRTYHNYAKRDGYDLADRYSARAGHSEHQSGFAMDINSLNQSFGNTKEGLWLAEHCAEYGFILRYGKEMESSTGFMYEPWHLRYLGTDLAKTVTESGLSLEEFLGITSEYQSEGE